MPACTRRLRSQAKSITLRGPGGRLKEKEKHGEGMMQRKREGQDKEGMSKKEKAKMSDLF